MKKEKSIEIFINALNKNINALKESLGKFLGFIASGNKSSLSKQATDVQSKVRNLKDILPEENWPKWLQTLDKNIDIYINNRFENLPGDQLRNILNFLDTSYNLIQSFKDSLNLEESVVYYDFDEVYRHYRDNSRIPELFNKIIEILEKIINSDKIDEISIKNMNKLKSIIATLYKTKKGSYFSLLSTWNILTVYSRNLVKEITKKIPVLNVFYNAYEKTLEEMEPEIKNLHDNVKKDFQEKFKLTFSFLPYKRKRSLLKENSDSILSNSKNLDTKKV